MTQEVERILVVQTAFLGDVVLTLPLVQILKIFFPSSDLDIVVVPRSAELLQNHPAFSEVIPYDKHGKDSGMKAFVRLVKKFRSKKYDLAFIPHRSLRSALLVRLSNIPIRIGFTKSAGKFFFTKSALYDKNPHEIERNIALLKGIGITYSNRELPSLYPSDDDRLRVDKLLFDLKISDQKNLVGIAPGTVWNTKCWLKEHFVALTHALANDGFEVILVGGKEDENLCTGVQQLSESMKVYNTAGKLSLLQSAELIRRGRVLISNDSAPMHIAVAMRTPVVAIFGATVPQFGFAPYGEHDVVVETLGLPCRPCSNHGGDVCPIKTFECMKAITPTNVLTRVLTLMRKTQGINIQT